MRILLVAPDLNYRRLNSTKTAGLPFFLPPILRVAGINYSGKRRKAVFPPLGLVTVAGLTPKEHDVHLIDEAVSDMDLDFPADLVGITCNTSTSHRAYQIADSFRSRDVKVVMGGIHPTASPEEALQHCDAVVVGEAEGAWSTLLEDLEAGRNQQIYRNQMFPQLGGYPFPRRDLLDRAGYWVPDTINIGRGCPNDCEFCSVTKFYGRKYRTRPVEEVIGEIRSLRGNLILFVDDNIMSSPEYAEQLFRALIRLREQGGRKIRWYGQASLTMMKHPKLLFLAAKSGCRGLFIGFESIFSARLKEIGKPFNKPAEYKAAIAKLHSLGIRVIGAFVFSERDDRSTISETVRFANRAKIDLLQYTLSTPLPGTKLDKRLKPIVEDRSRFDCRHVTFQHPTLSTEQLQEAFNQAYLRTYSYPSILRRLSTLRGDLAGLFAANMAFRIGTYGWVARGD